MKNKIWIFLLMIVFLIFNQSVFSYELSQSQNARIVSPAPWSVAELEKWSEVEISWFAEPNREIAVSLNVNILEDLEIISTWWILYVQKKEQAESDFWSLPNEGDQVIVINTMTQEIEWTWSENYQIPSGSTIRLNWCKSYEIGDNEYAKNLTWEINNTSWLTLSREPVNQTWCILNLKAEWDDWNYSWWSIILKNSDWSVSSTLDLNISLSDDFPIETWTKLWTAPWLITVWSGALRYRFTNLAQWAVEAYDHIKVYDFSGQSDPCSGDMTWSWSTSSWNLLFDEDVHRNYVNVNQPALIKMEMTKEWWEFEDYTFFNFPWGWTWDNSPTMYLAIIENNNYDPNTWVPYAYFWDENKTELWNTIKDSFKIDIIDSYSLWDEIDLSTFPANAHIWVFLSSVKTDEDWNSFTTTMTSNSEIKIDEDWNYEIITSPKKYLNIAYDNDIISDPEIWAFNTTLTVDDLVIPSAESLYILEATYLTEASLSRNEQAQSIGTDSKPVYLKSWDCTSLAWAGALVVFLSDPYWVFYDSWTKKIISDHSIFFEIQSTFNSENAVMPLIKPYYIKSVSNNGRFSILTPPWSFEFKVTHMMPWNVDIEDDNFKNNENFLFPSQITNETETSSPWYYKWSPDYTEIYLWNNSTNWNSPIRKFQNIIHRDIPLDPAVWWTAKPWSMIKIFNDWIEQILRVNGSETSKPWRFSFFVNKWSYNIEYLDENEEENINIEWTIDWVDAN